MKRAFCLLLLAALLAACDPRADTPTAPTPLAAQTATDLATSDPSQATSAAEQPPSATPEETAAAGPRPSAATATPVAPATPVATAAPPAFPPAQPTPAAGQRPVMVADHAIAVTLDPRERALSGRQRITYRNTATRPFDEIILHLYLNAFRSADTVFMRESGGELRGEAFDPQSMGFIDITAASTSGAPLKVEPLEDGTLARVRLPRPVAPGGAVTLDLEFSARLPRIFARTGWAEDEAGDPFFLVAQWFPKPGVWTESGWRADVFHGNAEFFADFGRYVVEITLPEGYVTGASGVRDGDPRPAPGGMQTVRYTADGVIDFAWVASPNLRVERREAAGIPVEYLYLPEHDWSVEPTFRAAAMALQDFSDWFGPYPYPQLSIVDVPEDGAGAGGMEYPSFVTVGASGESASARGGWQSYLEIVTVHEIAHQWWQSVVATDEGREPWLDEGFADFSTVRLFAQRYGLPYDGPEKRGFASGFLEGRRRAFLRGADLPMLHPAWGEDYSFGAYATASYAKPDIALMTLENQLGEETMLEILSTYYDRYRFAHPTTADFERVAVEVSGQPLEWFFEGLVRGDDTLNWKVTAVRGSAVRVEREGEISLPVDVAVTLQNGKVETVTCPAGESACDFRFDAPVRAAEADPQRKLVIDLDWGDNAAQPSPTP